MLRSELLDDPYMSGACHIHAMACVAVHGGGFAILQDFEDVWGHDEDGDAIPSIWHVWSVHETADGLIARDVSGDVPVDELRERSIAIWPELESGFNWGDMTIDPACSREVLSDCISTCRRNRPLCEYEPGEINAILDLETVVAPPGGRPAGRILDVAHSDPSS